MSFHTHRLVMRVCACVCARIRPPSSDALATVHNEKVAALSQSQQLAEQLSAVMDELATARNTIAQLQVPCR